MTTLEVSVTDTATAFVAGVQNFNYGDDLVEVRPITSAELLACNERRFITPASEEWSRCGYLLRDHRVLILLGDTGTGRHTAALRQLLSYSDPENIFELEPTWSRPQRRFLPPGKAGHGYILDLSGATQEPAEDFGKSLLSWASESQSFLVVLVTGSFWVGEWTRHLNEKLVSLPSPNARLLVERQLAAFGASDRAQLLNDEALTPIWLSSPKAEDASRLAEIIRKSSDLDPKEIADEYSGWENWLDEKFPRPLGTRTLLWSAALCDGGRMLSILQMSEALRKELGEDRSPAAVLADTIASKRLKEAHIKRTGDRVWLAPERHGLAAAARRHLWDECQLHRELLTKWAVNQAARLPADDAARVINALLELALQFRDGAIIRQLRKVLLINHQSFLATALSKAAIDPRFGPYIRGRLYTWLAYSPPQQLVDLVAEVCGGVLGREKPQMALVRLQRAALKTTVLDSTALANAFTSLAKVHRDTVLQALFVWLSTPSSERAGIVAFLGLASTDEGMVALCGLNGQDLSSSNDRDGLVATLKQAIAREDTQEATYRVMETWASMVKQGLLPESLIIKVLGAALAPSIKNNVMKRFLTENETLDVNTFWGKVFLVAAQHLKEDIIAPAG